MTIEIGQLEAKITHKITSVSVGNKYEITFKFLSNDENIKVFVRDDNFARYDLVLDTDYSLTIKDGTGGIYGEIEILKEIKDIKSLSIIRDIPISQDVVFDSQTVFSGTTEAALDKLTMIAQDNKVLSRSLHVSDDDVVNDGDLELPLAIAGSGVVYRDEKGKFHVGEYGEVSRALRQESSEFPDDTFALNKFARANKYLCFDDNGSVDLREILKSGTHVTIGEDGKLDTTNLSTVAYSGSYNDLSDKIVAGNGIIISDNNVISAPLADKETAGLVQVGDNISINSSGIISIQNASYENKGVVSIGDNISITDGQISVPIATEDIAGVVQIGSGLSVINGVINLSDKYVAGDCIHISDDNVISFRYADINNWESFDIPTTSGILCGGQNKLVAFSYSYMTRNIVYRYDNHTWKSATLPISLSWRSVCYGNGKFVAVASGSDKGAYSEDGINWTEITLPTYAYWDSVCYGNGKFVAVAYNSNIGAYSSDGINWTESTLPSSTYWESVCYGNGKFVAVASGSDKGAYSEDGINWTEITLPSSTYWRSVCYGNGKFVAVADSSNSIGAYSSDGINWTEITLPSSTYWRSVCYGGGRFVAVAIQSVAYSLDGKTWSSITTPSSKSFESVVYFNGDFIIYTLEGIIFRSKPYPIDQKINELI